MFVAFFRWWYADGWLAVARSIPTRGRNLNAAFSTASLLRTLFQPWRRIVSYPGAGLDAKIHAALDNLFSRAVGFVVRIFVLLAALIGLLLITLVTLIELVAWPLLPFGLVIFMILAIAG